MRTEEDKIIQTDIEIILGGKKYFVKPLSIKNSRKWRAKFATILGELPQYTNITTETPEKFREALSVMLCSIPDKVVELVFEYIPELDKERIEEVAIDSEFAKAFEQIVEVSFPLVKGLVGTMGKLAP